MRTVVTVLNICSSLASLALVWLGLRIGYFGLLGLGHGDYSAIALGGGIVAVFLIAPMICVIGATKLAQRDNRASLVVSLIPLLLVAALARILSSYH